MDTIKTATTYIQAITSQFQNTITCGSTSKNTGLVLVVVGAHDIQGEGFLPEKMIGM